MNGPPAEGGAPKDHPEAQPTESGADRLAREMRERRASQSSSPAPTEQERETFASLLSYHYGKGTIEAEDFSRRVEAVWTASTLEELYHLTADLPFPPPVSHLQSTDAPRRRRWWRR